MPVGVGNMEVRTPLDTTVDAVLVIVMFALVVVGTRMVVTVPLDTIVVSVGMIGTLTTGEVVVAGTFTVVDVVVGLRIDVRVPLETTVVAV